MTPQERDVIAGIFDRLKQVSDQPRDPEAERFIAERLAAQPYAPYAMAQAVHVQEQALLNLQARIDQLQQEVEDLRSQPQPQAQGGFLSGLFGGGAQPSSPPQRRPLPGAMPAGMMAARPGQPQQDGGPAAAPPQAGPWGQRPGGGFLATAMTTAAGVAGGMVLGNVLMNAFQGDKPPAADATAAAPPASEAGAEPQADPQAEPASFEDPGTFDDGGGFDGGDWA
jgi:hypothetical protein